MHKLFGPHLGVLLARRGQAMDQLVASCSIVSPGIKDSQECFLSIMESGTSNIEACAGVIGLGAYFKTLANFEKGMSSPVDSTTGENAMESNSSHDSISFETTEVSISLEEVKCAYALIQRLVLAVLELLANRFRPIVIFFSVPHSVSFPT
jgi:hypothetical protein